MSDRGPHLSDLPGAAVARVEAMNLATMEGFPPGWLLFRRMDRDTEGAFGRWTAARGFRAPIWCLLALRCGLRSTLASSDLDALRAETHRQEWLLAAYLLGVALTRTVVLLDGET